MQTKKRTVPRVKMKVNRIGEIKQETMTNGSLNLYKIFGLIHYLHLQNKSRQIGGFTTNVELAFAAPLLSCVKEGRR
jgi:hypothetical protein